MSTYWHGGQAGLRPGQSILPPRLTGARATLLATARAAGMETPARDDVVYVTTDYAAALLYAVMHPSGGAVYLVEPRGELRPDPDCSVPGLSYECDRATIRRAYRPTPAERGQVFDALGVSAPRGRP